MQISTALEHLVKLNNSLYSLFN